MARLGLVVILFLTVCRGENRQLGDVIVDLAVVPDPPHIGPVIVAVTLSDSEGQPLTGAEMSLEANMNHAGMVPVLAEASEVSPGRYEASLEFTMAGDWFILVQAALPDGRSLEHKADVPGVEALYGTPNP